jgi:predicted CXXCH cytochrome family protein
METERVHSPAARDCLRCHESHSSTHVELLTQELVPLCADCHDVDSTAFSGAHLGIDPQLMNCTKCHDPHASLDPKLFLAEIHAPFGGGACDSCHIVEEP